MEVKGPMGETPPAAKISATGFFVAPASRENKVNNPYGGLTAMKVCQRPRNPNVSYNPIGAGGSQPKQPTIADFMPKNIAGGPFVPPGPKQAGQGSNSSTGAPPADHHQPLPFAARR